MMFLKKNLLKKYIVLTFSILTLFLSFILGICLRIFWLSIPSITAIAIFLPVFLISRSNITSIFPIFSIKAAKEKLFVGTFIALLVIRIFLYFVTPLYIMPWINEVEKRNAQSLTFSIIKNSSSDWDKGYKIYVWMNNPSYLTKVHKCYVIDNYIVLIPKPPFICLRLIGNKYPYWFLFSRCGACMEYSLLYREMAYIANLTVRSVHNPGEDHNWDEVLINGKWIIVDPSWPLFNPSPSFYEMKRNLNISYVYAEYPNGTLVDITSKYTNTSVVKIVVTENDKPVKNVKIEFYSLNYRNLRRKIDNLDCITDINGSCQVRLGGGKYIVKAIKNNGLIGYSGEVKFKVEEGKDENIKIVIYEDLMHLFLSPSIMICISETLLTLMGFVWLFLLYTLTKITAKFLLL